MVILWILEALSFVLRYVFGFIAWLNGLVLALDLLREWTEFPKKWREDREKVGGSNQPPTAAGR